MLMLRCLVCATALVCVGITPTFAQVPEDLQKALLDRQESLDRSDPTAWDRMTSSEFTLVAANGRILTKAERLAELKRQRPRATAAPPSQRQVRVYGSTAIERVRSRDAWAIQVWVKQAQGWQVVATQVTTAATR